MALSRRLEVAKRLAEIANRLVDLDEERQRLMREMATLIEEDSRVGPGLVRTVVVRPDATVEKRLLEILHEQPGRVFTAEELDALVGRSNLATIRSTLSRLVRDNKIEKHGRSGYVVAPKVAVG